MAISHKKMQNHTHKALVLLLAKIKQVAISMQIYRPLVSIGSWNDSPAAGASCGGEVPVAHPLQACKYGCIFAKHVDSVCHTLDLKCFLVTYVVRLDSQLMVLLEGGPSRASYVIKSRLLKGTSNPRPMSFRTTFSFASWGYHEVNRPLHHTHLSWCIVLYTQCNKANWAWDETSPRLSVLHDKNLFMYA